MIKRRHKTPPEFDYLFERALVDEADYVAFWAEFWSRDEDGRDELANEYAALAVETGLEASVGMVTRDRDDAAKQAQALSELTDRAYRVVRRRADGRFSKRGTYYQAVKKTTKK